MTVETKWFFSRFDGHLHAFAPDGTKYAVPEGKMDSYLGSVLLNAMAKALANPPDAPQAGDPVAELEQENRLMRARMERLEAERTALLEAVCKRIGQACGPNSVAEMAVRADFLQLPRPPGHAQPWPGSPPGGQPGTPYP